MQDFYWNKDYSTFKQCVKKRGEVFLIFFNNGYYELILFKNLDFYSNANITKMRQANIAYTHVPPHTRAFIHKLVE